MPRYVGIGKAAAALGVSITTLRRWEAEGKLDAQRTPSGHRRYDLAKLRPEQYRAATDIERKTIAYARISSHDQKADLERQTTSETMSIFKATGSAINSPPNAGADYEQ